MNKNLAYELQEHAEASHGVVIDSDVAPPSGPPERRKSKRAIKVPPGVKACLERYVEAYRKVFAIPPEAHWDGRYIRIRGQSEGVTLKRLREMVKQLKWRAG